jgi:FlaA1/EpsC-like NDP-sugar epimerase
MAYDALMDITYENVIGKSESSLNVSEALAGSLKNERILITGAGGSIGSRIATAITNYSDIVMLATDRDENRLHSLSLELMGTALFESSQLRVLDIRDSIGVENLIRQFEPTVVIHSAALKHLAILEKQPREAYLTNFLGTRNLLESASKNNVQKFLNISTDKAANPISILGKTKYMSEILTTHFRHNGFPGYTNVRFGNVFNSKGSVIETFTQQIRLGVPVTLTDPQVSRYFMKIEEAANLSLLALTINEGDVHVLDMGEPVMLSNVINRMMEILEAQSEIKIVGLRDGEKLHEELRASSEIFLNSSQDKISLVNLPRKSWSKIGKSIIPLTDSEALLGILEFVENTQIEI